MKANTLNNVRSKLESTLDDLEDELQMEKKAKILMDKVKRKKKSVDPKDKRKVDSEDPDSYTDDDFHYTDKRR